MTEAYCLDLPGVYSPDELRDIEGAPQKKWFCEACDVPLVACAATKCKQNGEPWKKSAYFRVANDGDRHGCGEEREGKQREIKEPVTRDNPPEVWINELVEREGYIRAQPENGLASEGAKNPDDTNSTKQPKKQKQGNHSHTTATIRTICKHYAWFPHVRDLPIKLPGCSARLYKYAFRSFRQFKHDRPHYDGRYIFFGAIWKGGFERNGTIIRLNCLNGKKVDGFPNSVIIEVETADWTEQRRKNFILEIKQAMQQLNNKNYRDKTDRDSALVFALADQDEIDPYLFRVSKRSRTCVLYDYVQPPAK